MAAPSRNLRLFISGSRDDVLRFPGSEARLQQLPAVLTGLRGSDVLEGAGHWIQRARASGAASQRPPDRFPEESLTRVNEDSACKSSRKAASP